MEPNDLECHLIATLLSVQEFQKYLIFLLTKNIKKNMEQNDFECNS